MKEGRRIMDEERKGKDTREDGMDDRKNVERIFFMAMRKV